MADHAADYAPSKKKSSDEAEKRRKKLTQGSLLKAIVRSGGGDANPSDGDQVIFHSTIRTIEGAVVNSTRSEHGGKGKPSRLVLGKSKMILGLAEGFTTMLKGEIAMFKMKPEIHYAEQDCPVVAPENFPKDDELQFEIDLLDFSKAKVVSEDFGVVKTIINEGQGWESPRELYEITARITANTMDGKVILPSKDEPYFFTFGKSEVPKGLEMGIGTMTRSEKAIIYVTSDYLSKSSLIPSFEEEEIQFEVELVHFIQVRDMLGDGRLIKRRIIDGRGEFPMDCPLHDSLLRVHYKAMLLNEEKTVFYDTRINNNNEPLEFSSGEGLVPEGLEMCVRLMLPGEICKVTCPPDYAYDKFKPRPDIVPEGAHVQWEIELLGFEMPKDWTGLTFNEIMQEADEIKNTGNRLFKKAKFELAKAKYEKVLREYNHVNPQDDEEGKIFANSRNSLHLNVAACYHKMGESRKSIESCNKVLDGNPLHIKALYRRGMAHLQAGDFEDAKQDFDKMVTIDKSSEPDATAALVKLKQTQQETEKKARKQFKGLFDKKPGEISEAGSDLIDTTSNNNNNNNSEEIKEELELDETTASRNINPNNNNNDNNNVEREGEEFAFEGERVGIFGRVFPIAGRIFYSLGLNRCSIL